MAIAFGIMVIVVFGITSLITIFTKKKREAEAIKRQAEAKKERERSEHNASYMYQAIESVFIAEEDKTFTESEVAKLATMCNSKNPYTDDTTITNEDIYAFVIVINNERKYSKRPLIQTMLNKEGERVYWL